MKKKTVTSETEEITIDNKKQKRKREKKAYREIRWDRLDNTAHLFPVIAGFLRSGVCRYNCNPWKIRVLLCHGSRADHPYQSSEACGQSQICHSFHKENLSHRICDRTVHFLFP